MAKKSDRDAPQCPSCGTPMASLSEDQAPGWGCANQECDSHNPSVIDPHSEPEDNSTPTANTAESTASDTAADGLFEAFHNAREQVASEIEDATADDENPPTTTPSNEPSPDGTPTDTETGTGDVSLQCARCDEPVDQHQPECPYCGFTLPSFAKTTAMFLVGLALTFTIIGAIIGIPLMISATVALAAKGGDHPNSIATPADD